MNFSKTTDVLIIGGGVIGLALARQLRRKGVKRVTILEKNQTCGMEASNAAAGMLALQAETDNADDFFYFCRESHDLYSKFAKELLDETGVDIKLDQSGTLYLAFTENDSAEICRRFEWQKKAGLEVDHLTAADVRKAEPFVSPEVREALFFPKDWQVENRRLLTALQKFAELNQIQIVENAEVKSLLTENGKVIGTETAAGKLFGRKVILTTGAWTSLIKFGENAPVFDQIKPMRGQMLSFQTVKRLFSRVIYSPRGYLVPRFDGRILAGATVEDAGFDKSVTASGIDFLLGNALEIAPGLVDLEISEKWAGLRPFATDGLPVLGDFPKVENLFVATAHFRNGILLAPLTAEIMADRIVENSDSKYLDVFSPRRFNAVKAV
ncbi:glycine oxidase ThiO [soil metagenome]|jgi:glycine oxidase|nr:glycine oxidase ThiO [Acidobacteriota bacterium]